MKALLTATALSAATMTAALPATAFDPAQMSNDESAAFGEAVRNYLVENPEVIIEALNVLEQRQADEAAQADLQLVANNHDAIFNDDQSWVGGNPDGDITVVEFVDYNCGYCKQVNPQLEQLITSDGNIRFILKEYPILSEDSERAARFAIAVQQIAGDDAYKEVHDALMAKRQPTTQAALDDVAREFDLDPAELRTAMDSTAVTQVLRANHDLGRIMNIQGTPTFIIEDQMLRGIPAAGLQAVVDHIRETKQQQG